jgi:hypothetical protein
MCSIPPAVELARGSAEGLALLLLWRLFKAVASLPRHAPDLALKEGTDAIGREPRW